MENSKYPIGRYQPKNNASPSDITGWIGDLANFPPDLEKVINTLTDPQLDTPYRENGWTVRQLIHHIADSHINAYIRFKLALTEEEPTIKPYNQDLWAELEDSDLPVKSSLMIIKGIHRRWVYLLEKLENTDLDRVLNHPESGTVVLKNMINHYAWHGKHHLAHITSLKKRNNWS